MNESTTSLANASGPRTLIYVHGRNFKPAPDALLELVLAALETGLERDHPECVAEFRAISKRLAYYADHSKAVLESRGDLYDERLDLGDCRNALQQLKAYAKRKKFSLTSYDRLPGKSAVPELTAGVAAPLLGSLGLSGKLIGKVLPELHEYWQGNSTFAAAARGVVRTVIGEALAAGEQILLVSHGTGCIITWDALWQLSRDPAYEEFSGGKIDTWVTLGAPLGDAMVKRRLLGARLKGEKRYPGNVITWHNVSAEDDWLSHDNTLADDFKPMLSHRQVSAIRDYRVYNLAVRYGRSDPHSALGYLVHPRMAQIVADWLANPLAPVEATRTPG